MQVPLKSLELAYVKNWQCTGHTIYNSGFLCRGQLTQWDVFMRQMQPLASQVPWMLVEGVSPSTHSPKGVCPSDSQECHICLESLPHQDAWTLA